MRRSFNEWLETRSYGDIKGAFGDMGAGIAAGARDKVAEYVKRIKADPSKKEWVMQGLGPAMRQAVEDALAAAEEIPETPWAIPIKRDKVAEYVKRIKADPSKKEWVMKGIGPDMRQAVEDALAAAEEIPETPWAIPIKR